MQVHLWRLHSYKLWYFSCSHHDCISGLAQLNCFDFCVFDLGSDPYDWPESKFCMWKSYIVRNLQIYMCILSECWGVWYVLSRFWREKTGMRWCTMGSAPREEWSQECGPPYTSLYSHSLVTVSFLSQKTTLPTAYVRCVDSVDYLIVLGPWHDCDQTRCWMFSWPSLWTIWPMPRN